MELYDPIQKNTIILKGSVKKGVFIMLHNKFKINGKNNTVTIEGSTRLNKGFFLIIGNYNSFYIGENCDLVNFIMRADGDRNRIIVENGVTLGGGYLMR